MIFKIVIPFLTLLFFNMTFPLRAMSSTLFLGNSGEAYQIGGHYYLRDFVEANIHENPYFHCSQENLSLNTKFELKQKWAETLQINKVLMQQKLCDLESLSPKLSSMMIKLIEFHQWELVDQELGLLPDDGQITVIKIDKRHQLANRSLNQIKISKRIWKLLSDENKIGLIVHEMLSSALTPLCQDNSNHCKNYYQSSRIARNLTSSLFMKKTYLEVNELEKLDIQLNQALNTNDKNSFLKVDSDFFNIKVYSENGEIIAQYSHPKLESIESFIADSCQKIALFKNSISVSYSLRKSAALSVELISFPTTYSIEYGTKINFFSNVLMGKVLSNYGDDSSCYEFLLNIIEP